MNARTWLQMGEATIEALSTIEKLTKLDLVPDAAIVGIKAVLHALGEGFGGAMEPEAVLSRIDALHQRLSDNDSAAIAQLHKRFPG